MKIGCVFPTCEIGTDPIAIRDFAQAAEQLGYSHLITYDHVLGAVHAGRDPRLGGPYDENNPFHEPFVLFGYLAALTKRLELVTGVIILPQRQTALVAKQCAELALLSGNRLKLGVGSGWNYVEYEALNESYATRGKRLDEQVELLRKLWTRPIPIWFGGFSAPALKRAARTGDGFLFGASNATMLNFCAVLREELAKTGRAAGFEIDAITGFGEGPDAWRKAAETWKAAGATHFSMRAMSTGASLIGDKDPGFKTPQQHIDALAKFIEVVRGV
jgi:alkanesulfonate monooxygenase SsuD/methylene tetrahydromethanopterin reductase-like flavin-dependent oxidoreductase (luciferase family)